VRPIVRHHHERRDGSGYPDGLRGDEIPLTAQIIGLVDAYDALTTPRAYQTPHSREEALAILREQATRGWRSVDLVEHLTAVV
jgi:putative two-component system response regulator